MWKKTDDLLSFSISSVCHGRIVSAASSVVAGGKAGGCGDSAEGRGGCGDGESCRGGDWRGEGCVALS